MDEIEVIRRKGERVVQIVDLHKTGSISRTADTLLMAYQGADNAPVSTNCPAYRRVSCVAKHRHQ